MLPTVYKSPIYTSILHDFLWLWFQINLPTLIYLQFIGRIKLENASYVVLFPSIISIKLIISSAIIKFHRLQIKIKSDKIQFVKWIQQAENQMS